MCFMNIKHEVVISLVIRGSKVVLKKSPWAVLSPFFSLYMAFLYNKMYNILFLNIQGGSLAIILINL